MVQNLISNRLVIIFKIAYYTRYIQNGIIPDEFDFKVKSSTITYRI
jgi:hypothetical protein